MRSLGFLLSVCALLFFFGRAEGHCPDGTTCRRGIGMTCEKKGDCFLGRCCDKDEPSRKNCPDDSACVRGFNTKCNKSGECILGTCCRNVEYKNKCDSGSECVYLPWSNCELTGVCQFGRCCRTRPGCPSNEECLPFWRRCWNGGSNNKCRYSSWLNGKCCSKN